MRFYQTLLIFGGVSNVNGPSETWFNVIYVLYVSVILVSAFPISRSRCYSLTANFFFANVAPSLHLLVCGYSGH